MKLLALDTSSLACTAGVLNGDSVYSRYEEKPREHMRILMPMVQVVLAESGLGLVDLDAIVLGNGPGSFIGLRIGASVAQGLAHGAGLRIAAVSSLQAIALAAGKASDVVAVCEDAHMGEVYLGVYRLDGNGRITEIAPERLQSQDEIAELRGVAGVIAAGAGWQRYPDLLRHNESHIASISKVRYPHATELLVLGGQAIENSALVSPEDVSPAYLRHKVAEKPAAAEP